MIVDVAASIGVEALVLNNEVVDGARVMFPEGAVDVAMAGKVVLASSTLDVLLVGIELVILTTVFDEFLGAQTSTSASFEIRPFIGGSVSEHSVRLLMLFTPSNDSRV